MYQQWKSKVTIVMEEPWGKINFSEKEIKQIYKQAERQAESESNLLQIKLQELIRQKLYIVVLIHIISDLQHRS